MSEWITDRPPTEEDEGTFGYLWVTTENGVALLQSWAHAGTQPWMPITPPEPYVKPKRYKVCSFITGLSVSDTVARLYVANNIPTREAAEEIAAIYERTMP